MSEKSWRKNRQVVARRIGADTVLVPTGKDIVDLQCLFALNETGSFIWEQLARARTCGQIASAMVEEFEVTHEQAVQDLTQFIEELLKAGCIVEETDEIAER